MTQTPRPDPDPNTTPLPATPATPRPETEQGHPRRLGTGPLIRRDDEEGEGDEGAKKGGSKK